VQPRVEARLAAEGAALPMRDEEGVLSDWPDGIFNESMKEILEIQKAVKKKGRNKHDNYV